MADLCSRLELCVWLVTFFEWHQKKYFSEIEVIFAINHTMQTYIYEKNSFKKLILLFSKRFPLFIEWTSYLYLGERLEKILKHYFRQKQYKQLNSCMGKWFFKKYDGNQTWLYTEKRQQSSTLYQNVVITSIWTSKQYIFIVKNFKVCLRFWAREPDKLTRLSTLRNMISPFESPGLILKKNNEEENFLFKHSFNFSNYLTFTITKQDFFLLYRLHWYLDLFA